MDMMERLNVLGTELEECGVKSITGFFRDGYCNTNKQDAGKKPSKPEKHHVS